MESLQTTPSANFFPSVVNGGDPPNLQSLGSEVVSPPVKVPSGFLMFQASIAATAPDSAPQPSLMSII